MKQVDKEKFIKENWPAIEKLRKEILEKHVQIDKLNILSLLNQMDKTTIENALQQFDIINKEIKTLTREYSNYSKYCKTSPALKVPAKRKRI